MKSLKLYIYTETIKAERQKPIVIRLVKITNFLGKELLLLYKCRKEIKHNKRKPKQ